MLKKSRLQNSNRNISNLSLRKKKKKFKVRLGTSHIYNSELRGIGNLYNFRSTKPNDSIYQSKRFLITQLEEDLGSKSKRFKRNSLFKGMRSSKNLNLNTNRYSSKDFSWQKFETRSPTLKSTKHSNKKSSNLLYRKKTCKSKRRKKNVLSKFLLGKDSKKSNKRSKKFWTSKNSLLQTSMHKIPSKREFKKMGYKVGLKKVRKKKRGNLSMAGLYSLQNSSKKKRVKKKINSSSNKNKQHKVARTKNLLAPKELKIMFRNEKLLFRFLDLIYNQQDIYDLFKEYIEFVQENNFDPMLNVLTKK